MEELYGVENCAFIVHQLMHLVASVKAFGPLSGVSAFVFESNNGQLYPLYMDVQYMLHHKRSTNFFS